MQFIAIKDLEPGFTVIVGKLQHFDCMRPGSLKTLMRDEDGDFYVQCKHRKHSLLVHYNGTRVEGFYPYTLANHAEFLKGVP